MLNQFLRRLSVRGRIVGGFMILLVFLTLSVPLFVANHLSLTGRVQHLSDVEARSERELLLSLAHVLSSRVNLTRYADDLVPSVNESLKDIELAQEHIESARQLISTPDQETAMAGILAGMVSYRTLITEIQNTHDENRGQNMAALLSNAYQLEFNLEQQINNVASKNEVHVAESNAKALSEARQRLILFLAIYAALIFMAIVTAISVQASITRPLSSLYAAAEAFRLERKATNIPTEGADELTSLANSFNQITSDLVQSLESLEQRVVSRTKALATSTEVSRSLSNILDQNELVIEVVERVKEAFNYYHVHIYLFDQDRSELIMTGGTGEAGKALLEQGHRIPRGHGLVGRAAETNLPVLVPDTTADPDWLPNPFLSDTKAEVAVPIASGGIVLGVLDAQQNERDTLGQQDVDVLQSIASQVAIALQNSQTYRKTRQQAEHEALVGSISQKIQGETTVEGALQVAVRELGRALGSDYARIRLVTTQSQAEDIHPAVGS